MAFDTKPHRQREPLFRLRHLVDFTMASGTTDPYQQVYPMVKIGIFREFCYPNPRNGSVLGVGCAQWQ